jgi:hypothetical protein
LSIRGLKQGTTYSVNPGGAAIRVEQAAIKRLVGVVEEDKRAAIAALGHMVRVIGDDNTAKAGDVA